MSRQVFPFRTGNTPTGTAYVSPLGYASDWDATESNINTIVAAAGAFSNLFVTLVSAPGSGKSLAFTLRVNGSDSAMTFTISDSATTGSFVSSSIAVAAGDIVTLKAVGSGTPAQSNALISIDFVPTTNGISIHGGSSQAGNLTITRTTTLLSGQNSWVEENSVIALAGTISKLYCKLDGNPSPGSYVFAIYKNGTKQDGTSGTPDTRVTVASGSTTANSSFSLTVAAGDLLRIEGVPTGSPTGRRPSYGIAFAATSPDLFNIVSAFENVCPPAATGTQYSMAGGGNNLAWDGTETNRQVKVGTGFKITGMYAVSSAGTTFGGSGTTFNLRNNAAGTAFSIAIAGAASAGNDVTGSENIRTGDLLAIQAVPGSGAAGRDMSFAIIAQASGGNSGGNPKGGGKGPGKGPVTVQAFGPNTFQTWDSIMGFGQ